MRAPLNRRQIAWRAAQDIGDTLVVNLGIGMPVLVADVLSGAPGDLPPIERRLHGPTARTRST